MKRKIKFHKELLNPLLTVLLTGGFLITIFVSLVRGESLGWFASNKNVSASGAGVSVVNKDAELSIAYGTYTDGEWQYGDYTVLASAPALNLSSFSIPGSSARFKLRIHNTSDTHPLSVTEIGLASFRSENEVPAVIDGENYYLGTQLTACLVSGTPEEKTAARPLAAYVGDTHTLAAASPLVLYSGSTEISPNGNAEWIVELRFINTDSNQNAYANFGVDGNGTCTRQIYFMME